MFFAPGKRPRRASQSARERLPGACGARARQGEGRRRAASAAWAGSLGSQAPPAANPRAPSLLPPAPRDRSSRQAGLRKDTERKRWRAGSPRAGWKIADKGILETVELRNAGSSLGLRGAIPGVASLSACGSSAPGLWERLLRFCFGFNLNTENPPFASAARILQRRLPVRWRCGACRLGWGPRTPGACCLGAAVEPAPCETVAPDTHPTSARRGPRSVAAPGPRNPRRTRPQMPSQGWWSEPCMPPGMRSVRKPLCADLAWPPPPPSAAQENFF